MTKNSNEKESGVKPDEENRLLLTEIGTSEIPEESGWPKRKRIPRQLVDALNGCLCGVVLNNSSSGVLRCRQAGCKTQWVRTLG